MLFNVKLYLWQSCAYGLIGCRSIKPSWIKTGYVLASSQIHHFFLPLTQLETGLRSPYKYPVVSHLQMLLWSLAWQPFFRLQLHNRPLHLLIRQSGHENVMQT